MPEVNANGYQEYRGTYATCSPTVCTIGDGTGQGSGRIKIDCGSTTCTLNVRNSGSPAENGVAAILWKGTSSSNVVNITKGTLDIAMLAGESANISGGFRIGFVSNVQGDATVRCGSGVTIAQIDKSGGTLETNSNITTLNHTDGTHTILSGTVGTLTEIGGTIVQKGTGTMTTVTQAGGTLDFTQDMRPITVTTYKGYSGITLKDSYRRVTWTNGVNIEDCRIADVKIDLGAGVNLVVSAAA